MAKKPKVAITWLGGCGGCDEAVVDLNEVLLGVANVVDLVLWPIALDFKYHHIEQMQDGEIALSIINGNVRNSEQEEIAKLLRKKSQLVLAFGACACFGGTPGMANFRSKEDIFNWVYRDAPTVVNPKNNVPQTKSQVNGKELTLPKFYEQVFALNQVINVDYYLPGCPPPPYLVMNAVSAVLEGKLPPKGSTLAPHKAMCDTCPRNKTKPSRIALKDIKRIHEVEADPESCFLTQGIICLGPATRTGCGESCISINIPCRGCFGPVEGVVDSGAKFVSALASIIDAEDEAEMKRIVDEIDDPAGLFYRFTLPVSLLKGKRA
ncbi:MAG: oxidoreductase [Chloroflexi bacterium RBG_13_52_14]|nr:MAG: oxidoreductase [Chloroflexi bacterium RBG_13_52_14]